MHAVILVIHILLAIALIAVVLLQRSEGGALGIGGGGGMGGFMTGRGAANLLTRTTAILAAAFMVTSLTLAILATRQSNVSHSILDQPASSSAPAKTPATPTQAPAKPANPAVPAAPAVPKAPIGQ
ncbi:MAG TPA: preprotein translocase subunit SecG [Alphaproteobacteria bacterium]|nr:preprotein translocase subunit SecG [Alphaproteobacteria bacterium]